MDSFSLTFVETELPLAGAAALDINTRGRYTGAKLEPTLHLRTHDADPELHLRPPELHLRFTMPSPATDDDLVRYFESFAPF